MMKPDKTYTERSTIRMYNCDNKELMNTGRWDLAIVDPMYDMPSNYLIPGTDISTTGIKREHNEQAKKLSKQKTVGWPYFKKLIKVSKDQIIWGINYFEFAASIPGRLFWDKKNDASTFSNGELAACSKIKGLRTFRYLWNGMLQENMSNKERKIHAYQKPVALYKWLLTNYANKGDTILDTHGGSMSIAIACWDLGFDLDICELDTDYFNDAVERFENHISQTQMVFQ